MKKIIIMLFTIMLISTVTAEIQSLGTKEQNSVVNLKQVGAGFTFCNITSILYPNTTNIIGNEVVMTKAGTDYTFQFNKTEEFGEYIVNGYCSDTIEDTPWTYNLFITPNGEELKGDNFQIFTFLLFGFVIAMSIYLLIFNLAKLATASETIFGVAISWGVYFLTIITYWIIINYSTSTFLRSNVDWIIVSLGFTNFLLPLFSMVIAIFIRSTQKKNVMNVKQITGGNFRYG